MDLPVRWVKPEAVHLTLVFLGDIEESRVSIIQQVMDRVGNTNDPLELAVTGLGAFPQRGTPRVLWAGVDGDLASLYGIHKQLTLGLRAAGFAVEDRSLKPHITLARTRARWSAEHLRAWQSHLAEAPFNSGRWVVSEVALMLSHLQPQESRYTERYTCQLRQDHLPRT